MTFSPKWTSKFEIKPGKWVFVPAEESIQKGQAIKNELYKKWWQPPYFYHLRNGGHVLALSCHIRNTYFIHLDLKCFFSSVNRSKITRALKDFLGYKTARMIASESTVRNPVKGGNDYILPFGFVQSPIIASICLHKSKLGSVLHQLQREKDISVSVYVDDIIISTKSLISAKEALEGVKSAAFRSKFPLNDEKEQGPSSRITAFNIELSNPSMVITPERMDLFRGVYHSSESQYQKDGIMGYIGTVNPQQCFLI